MTDVFDQNTGNAPPNVSSDPFVDKLKTIVNDQGQPKYENTEKALEALVASQAHIKKLEDEAKAREQETQSLREKATKADALEEIVQRLTPAQKPTPVDPPKTVDVDEAITKKVQDALSAREAANAANANGQTVRNALVAKFGDVDKTREAIAAKAAELGMTVQQLGTMSTQSPKAVLQLFGVTAPSISGATPPTASPLNPLIKEEAIKPPEKSLLSGVGATDQNRKEFMRQIKEKVYKQYEVQTP